MTDRKRVGGLTRIDPAVSAWQAGAAENPATVSAKRRKDRTRTRIYVDITPELKATLERIAGWKCEDTSVSQVTEMLLTFGARAYTRGERELRDAFYEGRQHARTPRFTWNLEIPTAWDTEIEQFSGNGNNGGKDDGKD
jgi:hypothetical protein